MRHLEKSIETVAACPRLLTKAEVLALLGVTYTTVFTWMREGQFPLSIELGPPGGRSTKSPGWPTRSTPGLLPGPGGSSPPRRSSPALNQRSGGAAIAMFSYEAQHCLGASLRKEHNPSRPMSVVREKMGTDAEVPAPSVNAPAASPVPRRNVSEAELRQCLLDIVKNHPPDTPPLSEEKLIEKVEERLGAPVPRNCVRRFETRSAPGFKNAAGYDRASSAQ